MRRAFPVAAVAALALVAMSGVVLAWGDGSTAEAGTPALVTQAGTPALVAATDSQPPLLGTAYETEPSASASSSGQEPTDTAATPAAATSASSGASSAQPTPSASPVPHVRKPKAPKPATREHKARNVPDRPLDRHTGKRIVYDKALMTVWLMDKHNEVVGRYPVVGRWDRPVKGTYRIFSKSEHSSNANSKVTFDHMVRFTYGPDTQSPIGFHSIPRYYDGSRMHPVSSLGLPIATGGCIRMSDKAAKAVYDFMDVGDLVVVLPSP